MRVFRIKARNKHNKVVNMREYVGLDKLRIYGQDVWRRYNRYATAELYEYHHHEIKKWQLISDIEKVRRLINPYGSDEAS